MCFSQSLRSVYISPRFELYNEPKNHKIIDKQLPVEAERRKVGNKNLRGLSQCATRYLLNRTIFNSISPDCASFGRDIQCHNVCAVDVNARQNPWPVDLSTFFSRFEVYIKNPKMIKLWTKQLPVEAERRNVGEKE
jgi:hypothetical protein